MEKETKKVTENIIRIISFCTLILLLYFVMRDINRIQGTARIINYTGIVRGATQRLIKLEMAGMQQDSLIKEIEEVINELKYGGDHFGLIELKDEVYQKKVDDLILYWPEVMNQIELTRKVEWEKTNIINVSENFYVVANLATRAAENYSQLLASRLKRLEIITIIVIVINSFWVIKQSISAIQIVRENRILQQEAYQDAVSGIHNRSYFEHHMQKIYEYKLNYTLCYIDLDKLKYINDNFGHEKGDEYIRVFVRFIKNEIRSGDTFCRIGGDEFTLVMIGSNEKAVIHKLEDIRERFVNDISNKFKGSFSFGVVQITESNQNLPLQEILNCADQRMYEYKLEHKSQR